MINKYLIQRALDTIPDDMIANDTFRNGKVCSAGHLIKTAGLGVWNWKSPDLRIFYGVSYDDMYGVVYDNDTALTSQKRKELLKNRLEEWLARYPDGFAEGSSDEE